MTSHAETAPPRHRVAPRCSAGFTLIELLVIFSVIAVLVALLMPMLSNARHQANRTVCMTQQRQLTVASLAYAADHKNHLLSLGVTSLHWVTRPGVDDLRDYTDTLSITNCPDYEMGNTLADGFDTGVTDPDEKYAQFGYFYTPYRTPDVSDLGYLGSNDYPRPTRLNTAPTDAVLWADRQTLVQAFYPSRAVHTPRGWSLGVTGDHPIDDLGAAGANVGLIDGSAEWRRAQDLEPHTLGVSSVALGWW